MVLKKTNHNRDGHVTLLLAVSLTVTVGILALNLDGGRMMEERRRVQSAADAAALAAAKACADAGSGGSSQSIASTAARSNAAANGYANDGINSTVTVNFPPSTGSYQGKTGYVEVLIQSNLKGTFARIFTQKDLVVKARGVASFQMKPTGILCLDPKKGGALTLQGSASVNVNGTVMVNSSDGNAVAVSNNASLNCSELEVTGQFNSSAGIVAPVMQTGVAPTPDPLASLPPPDPSSLSVQSSAPLKVTSGQTLAPGVYMGGINISGKISVNMQPGIYYLQGGGFAISGGASLTANGVLIYNGPDSKGNVGPVNLQGGGALTISPMTSGPYQGISLFQDRTSNQKISLSGSGTWNFTGTVYAAAAPAALSGVSGTVGSQWICDSLNVAGTSSFTLNPTPGNGPATIGLVE